MSKLATRCSAVLIASGLAGLLSGCPQQPPPTTNVRPIPNPQATPPVQPTPGGSVIVNPSPGPSGVPVNPNPTANPSSNPLPGGAIAISSGNLPTGVLNFNYAYALQVAGGSGSYRWSVLSGNLPEGLTLDPNTGQIFGKPSQTGTYSFELQVIDNQKATVARRNMFILVSSSDSGLNDLAILTDDLPSAVVDRRYSRNLEVNGGAGPFSWNVTAGSLPDGLDLNSSTGEISGTPTLKGEETFTVRVTDSRGQVEDRTLSISVNATDTDLTILTQSLPVAVEGATYAPEDCAGFDASLRSQLEVTGGDVDDSDDYNWDISKGDLPDGMDLDSDGQLTGTPDAGTEGTYTFTVKVQDDADNSVSKVFTLEVRETAVYGFTPSTGGEDMIVTVYGQGLGSPANVSFWDGVSSPVTDTDATGNCELLTTSVPANAKAGLVTVNGERSTIPFIPENVVINEIFTNPADSESQYIELRNLGPTSVTLNGWYLSYTRADNGELQTVQVPPVTLAVGARTVVNLSTEMRFDPLNGTDASGLTRVALCKGQACDDDTSDLSIFRDYLQFGDGSTSSGDNLADNAVDIGLWSDAGDSIDVTGEFAELSSSASTTPGALGAHYGVDEDTANNGLLIEDNDAFGPYDGDIVLYYTPTGGSQEDKELRLRREVTSVDNANDRVLIDSPFFSANISSSNTGNGDEDQGVLIDSLGLLAPGDFINILGGSTIRTIEAFGTGNRLELNQLMAVNVTSANSSDGVLEVDDDEGLDIGTDNALQFEEGQPVTITVHEDDDEEFTLSRTITEIVDDSHVRLNSALASVTVLGTNDGEGVDDQILLEDVPVNLRGESSSGAGDGDLLLYNGRGCADPDTPCQITQLIDDEFKLQDRITIQVENDTVDGSEDQPLELDSLLGLEEGDTVVVDEGCDGSFDRDDDENTITEFDPFENEVQLGTPLAAPIAAGSCLYLVPNANDFTLVPGIDASITLIPNTGKIFFVPTVGDLRKYQSIHFDGSSTQAPGDYDTAAPSKGN